MSDGEDVGLSLMKAHVSSFNRAVGSGDYTEMLSRFSDDAELVFVGVPVGPFRGRDEIERAYAEQPPDDTIELLEILNGNPVVARYSWSREGGVQSGRLVLHERAGLIDRLVVTFERDD
jgi:steroid Delta-isomerase